MPAARDLQATILALASVLRENRPLCPCVAGEIIVTMLGHEAKDRAASVLVGLEEFEIAEARDGGWFRGRNWRKYADMHGWQHH